MSLSVVSTSGNLNQVECLKKCNSGRSLFHIGLSRTSFRDVAMYGDILMAAMFL